MVSTAASVDAKADADARELLSTQISTAASVDAKADLDARELLSTQVSTAISSTYDLVLENTDTQALDSLSELVSAFTSADGSLEQTVLHVLQEHKDYNNTLSDQISIQSSTDQKFDLDARNTLSTNISTQASVDAKADLDARELLSTNVSTQASVDAKADLDARNTLSTNVSTQASVDAKADLDARNNLSTLVSTAASVDAKADADARELLSTNVSTAASVDAKADADARELLSTNVSTAASIDAKADADARELLSTNVSTQASVDAKADLDARELLSTNVSTQASVDAKADLDARELLSTNVSTEISTKVDSIEVKYDAEVLRIDDDIADLEAQDVTHTGAIAVNTNAIAAEIDARISGDASIATYVDGEVAGLQAQIDVLDDDIIVHSDYVSVSMTVQAGSNSALDHVVADEIIMSSLQVFVNGINVVSNATDFASYAGGNTTIKVTGYSDAGSNLEYNLDENDEVVLSYILKSD